jgi:EAL domain-containing protein (putative c-di-GMP-specific phosphodiesterase class I)
MPEVHDPARDQFVALAFAAADLLIEIDSEGVITFVAGRADQMGVAPHSLTGLPLLELFEPSDRSAASLHLGYLNEGRPVAPVLVRLRRGGTHAVMFGGCQLPQGRTILFLALGDRPQQRHGAKNLGDEIEQSLMSRTAFTALATRRLAEDAAEISRLSFLEVGGIAALPDRLPAPVLRSLLAAIARQIRISGPSIEAVSSLSGGRFSVLHTGDLIVPELAHMVASLVLAAEPDSPKPSLHVTTLEPARYGLHGRHAGRVIRYAIERFAAGAAPTSGNASTAAPFAGLFADAASRVATLEKAIAHGAFAMAYQPVVRLKDRVVQHAEALARFPDGASPLAMIAAAEAADMIGEFDLAVCMRVVDQLERGVAPFPAIAVNLSGRSLETHDFVEKLCALLRDRGVSPGRLLFELTETAILTEIDPLNRVIQKLRQEGFRFCLDDLGSGANSFHYLRSIPMDFVKIDGAFGRDALENVRDRSFLRYVSGFCRENGIITIAEMIETEDQAAQYRELGIDYGQGYLFGHPEIPGQIPARETPHGTVVKDARQYRHTGPV